MSRRHQITTKDLRPRRRAAAAHQTSRQPRLRPAPDRIRHRREPGSDILYEVGDINRFPTEKNFCPIAAWSKAPWLAPPKPKASAAPSWATTNGAGLSAEPPSLPNATTPSLVPWPSDWKPSSAATSSKPTPWSPSSRLAPPILCSRTKPSLTRTAWWPS